MMRTIVAFALAIGVIFGGAVPGQAQNVTSTCGGATFSITDFPFPATSSTDYYAGPGNTCLAVPAGALAGTILTTSASRSDAFAIRAQIEGVDVVPVCDGVSGGVGNFVFAFGALHSCSASRVVDARDVSVTFSVTQSVADNGNGTADVTYTYGPIVYTSITDVTPPAPVISGLAATVGLGGDSVSIDFGETVTGFALSDLSLTNLAASNLQNLGNGLYSFNVVATADGTGRISLPADAALDKGTNGNLAASEVTTNAVASRPVVTFVSAEDSATAGRRTYTFNISRPGGAGLQGTAIFDGFENFELFSSTLLFETGIARVSGRPTGGDVTVEFAANRFVDAASGNGSEPFGPLLIETFDFTPPTVSIAPFTGALNGPQTAVITLSEDATDFVVSDLALTNATAELTGSGSVYTAVLTPQASGPVALSVGVGAFSDAAGNLNAVASNEVTSVIDFDAPTPEIAYGAYDRLAPFTATITFDEVVTGFEIGDITTTNATLSDFAEVTSGLIYSVTVTGTDILAEPAISVAAGVAQDLAGNDSLAATGGLIPAPDGTAAVVDILGVPDGFTGPVTATITFDWGEAVGGFDVADVMVTGGTLGAISGGPAIYTAELAVDGDSDVMVSVQPAAAVDSSGQSTAAVAASGAFASGNLASEMIAEFMGARNAALQAAQPRLRALLDSNRLAGSLQATRRFGDIDLRTGTQGPVWMALSAQWAEAAEAETAYTLLSFGTHMTVDDDTILGVMLQFDRSEFSEGVARIDGNGWLVGPYFAMDRQGLYVDARLLWGQTDNEIAPLGTYVDRFETERWLASVNVAATIEAGSARFFPGLELAMTEDRQRAYTDALSNPVPEQVVGLREVTARVDWDVPVADGLTAFTGGLSAIWGSQTGTSDAYAGGRGRLDLGLRRQAGDLGYSLGLWIDGIGQDDLARQGADIAVTWRF